MLFQGTTRQDRVSFKWEVWGFLSVPDLRKKNTITIFITINKRENSFKFSEEKIKDGHSIASEIVWLSSAQLSSRGKEKSDQGCVEPWSLASS